MRASSSFSPNFMKVRVRSSSIGQRSDLEKGTRGRVMTVMGSADEGDELATMESEEDTAKSANLSTAYLALTVLFLTFASNQWARQAIYYLCNFGSDADPFKHMNAALNFDKEMYATRALGFTVVFAFVSLFAGGASDKYDRSKVVALSCGWSACTALQSQAGAYSDLLPLRALVGFTQAFFNPQLHSLERRHSMIGTVNGIFSGGGTGWSTGELVIILDDKYGWAVNTIGFVGFGAAALNLLLIRDPLKAEKAKKEKVVVEANSIVQSKGNMLEEGVLAIKEVGATKEARLLLVATAFRFCAGFSIAIWKAPFIFFKFPGIAEQFSSSNAAIVAGGGLLSTLLGGFISDKLANPEDPSKQTPQARAWVPAVGSLLAAPAWAAFILAPTPELTAAALLVEYPGRVLVRSYLAALFKVVPLEHVVQLKAFVASYGRRTAPILKRPLAGGNLGDYPLGNLLLVAVSGAYIVSGVLFWLAATEEQRALDKAAM